MSDSKFRVALDDVQTSQLAEILQPLVLHLIDLSLQTKHAHWNVRGRMFLPLHEQLDTIHETLGEASDEIAERQITLGHSVDGTASSVAGKSKFDDLQVRFFECGEIVEFISNRLFTMIQLLREAIDQTGEIDPITQDLLIGITGQLEKHLWMLQVQQL